VEIGTNILYIGNIGWFVIKRTRKVSKETISGDREMVGRISWIP